MNIHCAKTTDECPSKRCWVYYIGEMKGSMTRVIGPSQLARLRRIRNPAQRNYRRVYSAKVNKLKGIKCDQTIKLNNFYSATDYPEYLRRVAFYDKETDNVFDFITNNFKISAVQVASLYKHRWSIELFFKWIKQHLRIKTFWGYSENAIRVQVYTAIISYLTIAIMKEKEKMKLKQSNYEILQILNLSLIDKIPIQRMFEDYYLQNFKELSSNQLNLNL